MAHLRKQLVPEILLRVWVGHSTEGITDKYALEGVKRDTLFRAMTAQKARLGFTLPELRPIAPTVSSAKCLKNWSALEDDFRTFLLMPGASESIFQQFKA